jgi:hypothetical protein
MTIRESEMKIEIMNIDQIAVHRNINGVYRVSATGVLYRTHTHLCSKRGIERQFNLYSQHILLIDVHSS